MALRSRRGNKIDFDPNKLTPGEPALVLDDEELYFCYGAGKTKKLQTKEDLIELLNTSPATYEKLQELIAELSNSQSLATMITDINSELAATAKKTYVDQQVQNVSSQVQGFYSSVEALTSARPSGDSNNYAVQSGGNYYVYRWNASAWSNTNVLWNASGVAPSSVTLDTISDNCYVNKVVKGENVSVTLPYTSGNRIGVINVAFPSTTFNTVEAKFDVKDLSNINKFSIMHGSTEATGINVSVDTSLDMSISGSNTSINYLYIKFYCTDYAVASFKFENLQIIINGVDITDTITGYTMEFSTGTVTAYENIFYGIVRQNIVDDLSNEINNELVLKAGVDSFLYDSALADSVIQYIVGRFNADGSINATQTNWRISDYIDLKYGATVSSYALASNVAIIVYDSNHNIITKITNTGADGFVTTTLTLDDGAYVKIQSCPGLSHIAYGTQKLFSDMTKVGLLNKLVKNAYASGYTYFKVYVNTIFPTEAITNAVLDSENSNYVWCALKLPSTYKETGVPTKLAVCMHGAGGLVYNGSAGELVGYENLVSAGYTILDCAGVIGDVTVAGNAAHMGGSVALQSYKKAIDYVIQNYNVESKIYLHGHSMGGLTALNFANSFENMIKVIGLFYPVTDMYNQAWLYPWYGTTTKVQIATAYNFADQTGATYEADKVIGFNPINNNSIVVSSTRYNFFKIPIKIWHGNVDTTVSIEGSQAIITAIKNAGGRAKLRTVDGIAHSTVAAMLTEQLYWFNRF